MEKERLYPEVNIDGPVLCFEPDAEARSRHVQSLHPHPFAETVNTEIKRLDGYYRACSDWLNDASRSQVLADKLGLSPQEYSDIAKSHHYLSHTVLSRLSDIAHERGYSDGELQQWLHSAQLVDVKSLARQRMLMMQSVLHSTPIIMADPFDGGSAGSYGFGDAKKTQIFEGKAEVAGLKFSAIASPKMHGYTFRFAVCNVDKGDYHDHNPALILDNRIIHDLEAWNAETHPGQDLAQTDLMKNMANSLFPNIHDWIHSWLLYDVQAKSDSFKQWGADIFFNVEHLVNNKLVINYELLTMSLHRYVWNTLFDHDPAIKDRMYDTLEAYLAQVHDYSQWVAAKQGPQVARDQEDYLAYVALSSICFVLDPKEPRMAALMARYPAVDSQVERILGKALELLHTDIKGVPSQFKAGDVEDVSNYVMRYPMADEVKADLKHQRTVGRKGDTIALDGDARKRIYTENMAEYETLPDSIRQQIVNIRDSNTYGMLNKALAKLPESLRASVTSRIELDDAGRMFFRVDRNEIDLTHMDVRTQDKRLLLVAVPKGEQIALHPRVRISLLEEVKRQQTIATDHDVVAFNISEPKVAEQILKAGEGHSIPAMIAKAKELAESGIEGADDIYPLARHKAQALFHFETNGFYESLNSERYVAQGMGPLVMKLQNGSDQKLFNGALLYMHFGGDSIFNADPDPDLHFIEGKDLKRTHKEPSGVQGVRPFGFKAGSPLMQEDPSIQTALPEFLETLGRINRTIDHGAQGNLASGLFV